MSDQHIIISTARFPELRLRFIESGDLENLRVWKNRHKNSFFLKQDITPEQQSQWYENFKARANDWMFVVEQKTGDDWESIGCLGFRELPDEHCVDAYNIMRGEAGKPAAFSMSDAFRLMLKYADSEYPERPIRCKVLCDNPAVGWYKKINFSVTEQIDNYYLMELDKETLNNLEFIIRKG